MSKHNQMVSLIVGIVQAIGDDLGIEFRNGTDFNSQAYKTNFKAHDSLYKHLKENNVAIGQLIGEVGTDGYERGRTDLQDQLKQLLGVRNEHLLG